MKYQNIILLGPPGSGKGTQAKKLAEKLNLFYFGTGDLIREEIKKKTEIGNIFDSFIKKGELVPDAIINQFIKEKIAKYRDQPMVFDGFPRTLDQAEIMKEFWPDEKVVVLNIKVSPESLAKRMEKRRICEKCGKIFIVNDAEKETDCDVCDGKLIRRNDDSPEVLAERIKVYEKQTAPLVDLYTKQGVLIDINGEPPIEEVEKEILQVING